MIQLCEATQSWLETITYQMNQMSYQQQSKLLGGPIGASISDSESPLTQANHPLLTGLLKSYATRCAHEVADDATNIFGGRGLTQSGMGRVVEQFHRTYKFDAILG